MKMIFPNVRAGDQTGTLQVDLASAGTRFMVKILHENPDLVECLYQNLLNYEKYAGYGPDVGDTAQAAELLRKVAGGRQ